MQQKTKPMTPENWTFDHEDFDLAYDIVGRIPDQAASKTNLRRLIVLVRRLTAFFVPGRKKPGGVVANTAGRSQESSRTGSDR
jgi:hypothetical protein